MTTNPVRIYRDRNPYFERPDHIFNTDIETALNLIARCEFARFEAGPAWEVRPNLWVVDNEDGNWQMVIDEKFLFRVLFTADTFDLWGDIAYLAESTTDRNTMVSLLDRYFEGLAASGQYVYSMAASLV